MDTTYKNPNENYFQSGATFNTAPPPVPTAISSDSLAPTAPLNLAPAPQDTTNYSAVSAGIPDYSNIMDKINAPTPAETTVNDSRTRLQKIIDSITGKGGSVGSDGTINTDLAKNSANEDYIKKFGYADSADATKQLLDVTNQINMLGKEAQAIPLKAQQQAEGRGVTAGGLAPIEAAQSRNIAIKRLGLASVAETIQGNISTAATLAEKAVNIEFAPIQAELNAMKQNYELNKDVLEREDKKKADALNFTIQERTRLLENAKEDKKTVYGLAAEAAKNGAPTLIVSKAQQMTNPLEALTTLSQYMRDPIAVKQAILQNQLTQSQINKNNADSVKLANDVKIQNAANTDIVDAISKITNPNETRSELGGLTLNGLQQKAQIYLTNGGNIQGLGLSSSGNSGVQRTLIANYAGYLADKAGLDIPQITALYKANSKAATDIIGRVAKVDAVSSALTSQFPRLQQLATNVGKFGITESDLTAGKTQTARKFGSVDAGNYIELIQTIRGDYASMQAALAGSKGGQFFAESAKDAIPLGLTPEQYAGIADTIRTSAQLASQATGQEATKLIGASNFDSNSTSTPSSLDSLRNKYNY